MGISFIETNSSETDLEVIEWDFPNINKIGIRVSKKEVLEQVLSGLELIKKSLRTNYKLFKIYFSPFNMSRNRIDFSLISFLIRDYHNGNELKEV